MPQLEPSPSPLRQRLGDLLVAAGLLDAANLDEALEEQRRSGERLGQVLVRRGDVTETQLVLALARQFGVESVDLEAQVPDFAAGRLVRESFARRHRVLPVRWDDGRLVVAMANPADVLALDDVRSITGHEVRAVMAEPGQLSRAIDRVWTSKADDMMRLASDSAETDQAEAEVVAGREATAEGPVVQFVNELLARAVHEGVSDVHLEPAERELRIRFRADGVLHDVMTVPRSIRASVVSRIKIMAEMDIAERRLPQDGRVTVSVAGVDVDLRLVTLPTNHGEALVVRILDRSTGLLRIDDLGFLPETLSRFRACYRRPWGAVLATGPTGSGKSTTMYAALSELHDPGRSIVTVEDPVEYNMPGIKQVPVNGKAGLTFAGALRSIVRADPDVLLVGEVRDRETATIAVEAALTGHLVLSTLHTNDAASTPARLLDMGVQPYLVTSALTGVLAQRLVRELCERCKEPCRPGPAELAAAGWDDAVAAATGEGRFHRAVGCTRCAGSGYRGRLAVHEFMPLSEQVGHLVLARASSDEVRAQAVREGMVTLREDCLRKVAAGRTTLEELARVVA